MILRKGLLLILAWGLAMSAASCGGTASNEESWQSLLSESRHFAALKQWEPATDYAIKALSSNNLDDDAKSLVLSHLASIDIMTWRDAQGWENAVEAERLARDAGTDTLIATALLQKGRLQLCGAITQGEAQDAEALETLQEAMSLSSNSPALQADILLQMSQAYIGLNRFRSPIDTKIYAEAGRCIDHAVAVSKDSAFVSKALPYWMRWYRQGGAWQDGIACCKRVLEGLGKEDFLMQSQCWNNLVMLYAQADDVEGAATAHQQYVYAMEYYMQQKADERLQEMETRYESSLKEARISRMRIVMIALIILAITLVIMIVVSQAYIRGIVASDRGKEQLLRLISKDLASPRSADSPAPDYATIRARCHELLGEDDGSMADEIASYITNLEEERSRRVKELGLTAREIEVIRLSAEGLSVAGIAERLHVSIYTIKNHKQNIYLKMDVRSNAEMLRLANELGIV
jgi:DNA-binding NarL/FixJ family response regulator